MRNTICIMSLLVSVILVSASCNKDDLTGSSGFDDDYETYINTADMFSNTNWTFYEQTYSDNTLTIVNDTIHGGANAIRFFSAPGDGAMVSKSGLASHGEVLFRENEVVRVSCWYYIPACEGLDKVFILDIEDPAAISTGPGIRLMFDSDNALFVERNKLGLSNISQDNKVEFPFDQWVNVVFEMKISARKKGYVKLWQDNNLLINESSVITLPKDRLYITQGTHKSYSNVEVGITANSSGHNVTMFIDDFSIWKVN